MPNDSLLILGLGNLICGDDGLGVEAVHRIDRSFEAPIGARVLDGGTLGLSLLPYLGSVDQAILVDAIRSDGPPGTLVRLEGDEVAPAVRDRLSPHQVGVADLIDGLRLLGRLPERLILVGLVPDSLALSVSRTEAVEARIEDLVAAVLEEAGRLGFPFRPKENRANDESSVAFGARGRMVAPGLWL